VYAEEAASDDDDEEDDVADTDDYDVDYSLEDKMTRRATHGKMQHFDTASEERHQHAHDKLGHQADLASGSVGMLCFPSPEYSSRTNELAQVSERINEL
jgi:hypothetical protein